MAKMVSLKATDFKAAGTKVGQIQKSMEGFASISAQLAALAEKVEIKKDVIVTLLHFF